jgi:uncharacterized membrane protein (UPF0127 family)
VPSHSLFRRSALAALGLSLSFAVVAPAAAQEDIPRQDPRHCQGQPVLQPLQPLSIVSKGHAAKFMVEMAATPAQRAYGLMCRPSLAADRGMLFDFEQPTDDIAFWMRNTLIGLDIVYIAPNGTILSIARHARPLDESPIPAGGTIRAVLEIADGRADQLGLKPGDRVVHQIFAK